MENKTIMREPVQPDSNNPRYLKATWQKKPGLDEVVTWDSPQGARTIVLELHENGLRYDARNKLSLKADGGDGMVTVAGTDNLKKLAELGAKFQGADEYKATGRTVGQREIKWHPIHHSKRSAEMSGGRLI